MASCAAKNNAGEPCGAHPLKGTEYCLAHSDPETRESVGFIPDNGKGGRPRLPRPTELARQLLEDNVIVALAPHFKALGYDLKRIDDGVELVEIPGGGAKLAATFEGEVIVSDHDDFAARIAAAEKLLDRVYGKPRQSTEVSGPDGGPLQVEGALDLSRLSMDELRAFRELLAKAGEADERDSAA